MSAAGATAVTSSTIVANTAFASHILRIEGYSRTKGLASGLHLKSCAFAAGGHAWHLAYLPNSDCSQRADFISLFLVLDTAVTEATIAGAVLAQFTISLLDHRTGKAVPSHSRHMPMSQFAGPGSSWGFPSFIRKDALEKSRHLKDDCFSLRCDVTVVTQFRSLDAASAAAGHSFVTVPPSDLPRHYRDLMADARGADVRFRVEGEEFVAHRNVLAARSPVFKAELYGEMMEGSEQHCVEIRDMRADVFRSLLHFVYTDALPPAPEREEEAMMAQHLLVAADRYGMERLKLVCEETLCRHVTVAACATTLVLAEQHRCKGLKEACVEFLKRPGALNAVMATDGFDYLTVTCPPLMKELMARLAAR